MKCQVLFFSEKYNEINECCPLQFCLGLVCTCVLVYMKLEKDPRYYIYILIHRTDCNLKEKFEGYYFFIII